MAGKWLHFSALSGSLTHKTQYNTLHSVTLSVRQKPLFDSLLLWIIPGVHNDKQGFRAKKLMGHRGIPELELLASNLPMNVQ